MKILLIAHKNPFPPDDGGSMGIFTMIDGLLLNNVVLDVLLMNPSKNFKKVNNSLIPQKINYIQIIPVNTDVKIFDALNNLIFQKESYFTSRFYDKHFEQQLIQLLKNNQYDIIQLESIFSAVYLDTIKKFSSAKIVLSAHNIEHIIWERLAMHEKNLIKKMYLNVQTKRLKNFEHKVFTQVDGITAVTIQDKKYIMSLSSDTPIVVTPNGMNIKHFDLTPFEQQDINTIFFLGSLDWLPNQQGIVWFLDNVWNKVVEQKPNLKLIVAGKKIPEWIKNREDKNTTYYSDVPDTKELYNKYAIMIVPLLAGSGIRVKIIEGMAYGKCIVSTSIGAEGVPYQHKKNIFIADTPQDFVNTIINLVQHPDTIRQAQIQARLLAEHNYDREKVYLPLVNMYKEILINSNSKKHTVCPS